MTCSVSAPPPLRLRYDLICSKPLQTLICYDLNPFFDPGRGEGIQPSRAPLATDIIVLSRQEPNRLPGPIGPMRTTQNSFSPYPYAPRHYSSIPSFHPSTPSSFHSENVTGLARLVTGWSRVENLQKPLILLSCHDVTGSEHRKSPRREGPFGIPSSSSLRISVFPLPTFSCFFPYFPAFSHSIFFLEPVFEFDVRR